MRWVRAILWLVFSWCDFRIRRPRGLRARWKVFARRDSWSRCSDCGASIFLGTDRYDGRCRDCHWEAMRRAFEEAWEEAET